MRRALIRTLAAMALAAGSTLPAGEARAAAEPFLGEIMFVGFGFCPVGWLPADGRFMVLSQNTALFSLLGTRYGGNGTTTFRLPRLINQVVALRSGSPPFIELPLLACIAVQGVFPPRP